LKGGSIQQSGKWGKGVKPSTKNLFADKTGGEAAGDETAIEKKNYQMTKLEGEG